MACLLTTGRKLPCKKSVGGLKNIYFMDYDPSVFTYDAVNGVINDITNTAVAYQYEIKGNSSLETTINSSRETGTTFYQSALNLTLTYLDSATQQEIQILAAARPHIIIEDYNGNFILVGYENGCDVNGGTIVTGAGMGEMSGFTLTFEAMETVAPIFVDDPALVTDIVSATNIDPTA